MNIGIMKSYKYSCSVRRVSYNSFALHSPGETAGYTLGMMWTMGRCQRTGRTIGDLESTTSKQFS